MAGRGGSDGSVCEALSMLGTTTNRGHDSFFRSLGAAARILLALALVAVSATASLAALPRRLTDHSGEACWVATPTVNGNASLVAFESTCDFTGENADGNREVFQVDRNGTISQLTTTVACTNANPSSNFSGNVVAFESNCDFGGNADGNVEIFTVASGLVTPIAPSANCDSLLPSINADGTVIYFDSNCDLTGANTDGSVEIFRTAGPGSVEQITDDASSSDCASINASSDARGGVVGFESDCDFGGDNAAQVNEIYESRPGVGLVRRTNSQGDSCVNMTPALSSDGRALAFASDCDLLGDNPDGSMEIYASADEDMMQMTTDGGTNGCESLSPSIGTREGSTRVVFAAYCDPTGNNPDGSFEIFSIVNGVTEQLTTGQSCWSVSPKMPASADAVVYISSCDLDGSGGTGAPELYIEGLCVCGGPVSASEPTATDALYALQAGIGTQNCPLCECDVNSDGRVAATDALRILSRATDQNVTLSCP
jgi:hypothetical protein